MEAVFMFALWFLAAFFLTRRFLKQSKK